MPLFNKCPHCNKNPNAVGMKPITIGEKPFDEWYCGECEQCVGTTPTPDGLIPATKYAVSSWNSLTKPRIN